VLDYSALPCSYLTHAHRCYEWFFNVLGIPILISSVMTNAVAHCSVVLNDQKTVSNKITLLDSEHRLHKYFNGYELD